MVYDPHIPPRKSIRLKGYDYSQEGLYFSTICIQNKKMLFGGIACPTPAGADPRVCPINTENNHPIPENHLSIPKNNQPFQENPSIPEYRPFRKTQPIQPFSPNNNDPQLTLNDAGKMIEKWFMKFPDIECDVFIVMPNHVHWIVNNGAGNPILGESPNLGANTWVRP